MPAWQGGKVGTMFRTRFNTQEFDVKGLTCETPSMTQQHFKDECDINKIVARAVVTGAMDPNLIREGMYADVSNIPDYQAALSIISEANENFMSLPANVRKRFDNNPANMLEFIQNPDNRQEAISLGLVVDTQSSAPVGNSSTVGDNA